MATETECDIRSFCLPFDEMNRNLHAVSVVEDVMSSLGISLTDPDPVKAASSDVAMSVFNARLYRPSWLCLIMISLHTEEMVRTVQNPRIIRPLALGARVIAFTLLRLMENPDLLDGIRREFESGKLRAADPVC